jgi:NAD+ synthase (glutamine-hydrolysing)
MSSPSDAPAVKVALVQMNPTVGDLAGNAASLVEAARRAYAAGARLVIAPELALTGYPPEDLLLRPAFMRACAKALADITAQLSALEGLHVVVGHPYQFGERGDVRSKSHAVQLRFNAASVIAGGRVIATYCKRELPNYQVFDERRYFASGRDAGQGAVVFDAGGCRFGLLICEDAWFDEPARSAKAAGAQALVVISARTRSARRAWPIGRATLDCRCSMRTSSVARTRSCSTGAPSGSMHAVRSLPARRCSPRR